LILLPFERPVPVYTQLEAFWTTYGTSLAVDSNMTPRSSCSGRLTGHERQFVVTRELSVPGAQGADGQKNGSGPGRVDERAWSL
jgi:hypothetical protein